MRILGVKVTTIAMFPASFVIGAIFESFIGVIGISVVFFVIKHYMGKLPKFAIARLIYQNFPTDKMFGKAAPQLLPSHIKKWVK